MCGRRLLMDAIAERLVQYAKDHQVTHSCIIASASTYFDGYGRYIEELSKKPGRKLLMSRFR